MQKINKKKLLTAMINAEIATNKQLADKAGISITMVSNIRQGRATTYETASKLAKALDISVNDLIDCKE